MSLAPGAGVYERPGTSHTAAAAGDCSSALEEELRQLAVQKATIDDLGFAYQLQLEEVLRASAENAGLAVSPRMFAPESEECLQRRYAVEAQVALHNAALVAQADKAVAQKVYAEQAEHIQEACRDHELAKDLEGKGDIAFARDTSSTATPVRVRVICCAINSHITGTMGYAAALCTPVGDVVWFSHGTVKSPLRQAAELKGLLHGLQKAHENGIEDLLMCTRFELLTQVMDTQKPQSSAIAEAIAAVQDAMAVLTVETKALDDSDLRLLLDIKTSRESREASISLYAAAERAATDLSGKHACEAAESAHHPDTDFTQRRCDICMDDLPAAAMHSVGTCMHQFCKGCLESHIRTQLRCRALPVVCPAVQCRTGIGADECSVLLHHKEDITLLTQLEAEAKIPASAKFWCPQKDCSRLLVVQKSTHREVECIACGTYLCTACRNFGHVGMTCAEAKASRVDDSGALNLATAKGWKSCPSCRHLIERQLGCNHMVCRCGAAFCYKCGNSYSGDKSQCRCDLFEYRDALNSEPGTPILILIEAPRPFLTMHNIMGGIRVGAGIRSARSTAGSGSTLAGKTRPDPALYKTVICRNWRSGECSYGARCAFAHGADELRKARVPRYVDEDSDFDGSDDY